jgi:hypothetical protein
MQVTVEARGFGESLRGEFLPLPAEEDTNPYSARMFITEIDKPTFSLQPGETVQVKATVKLPPNLDAHTRYAIIYIHSQPINAGNGVGQIQATSVPVIIMPKGLTLQQTGEISDFRVNPVEAGKPIEAITTVKNTGNHHFKVSGKVKISDSSGQAVAELNLPVTTTSILPTYAQELHASYQALERPEGLAPGSYTAEVQVFYEDGTPLGVSKTQFEVTAPYTPCPGIDSANIFLISFKDQEPGTIDARDQTGMQISFDGTGKVTGSLVICKYSDAPDAKPPFANDPGDGGTGQTALSYVIVAVEGFNSGEAHLGQQYSQNSLGNVDPNSLFLAYKDIEIWRKLENQSVQTGAELVVGDLPVNVLNGAPLIALGGGGEEMQQVVVENPGLDMQTLALVAGGAVLIGLVIGLAIMLATRRRAKRS